MTNEKKFLEFAKMKEQLTETKLENQKKLEKNEQFHWDIFQENIKNIFEKDSDKLEPLGIVFATWFSKRFKGDDDHQKNMKSYFSRGHYGKIITKEAYINADKKVTDFRQDETKKVGFTTNTNYRPYQSKDKEKFVTLAKMGLITLSFSEKYPIIRKKHIEYAAKYHPVFDTSRIRIATRNINNITIKISECFNKYYEETEQFRQDIKYENEMIDLRIEMIHKDLIK